MSQQAGWRPDPSGSGERWHDGRRWTGVTRPDPHSAQRAVRQEKRRRRRSRALRVIAAGVAIVCLGAGGVAVVHAVGRKDATDASGPSWHRLLPAVTPRTASLNYTINKTDAAGDPVTYDPCEPIHYAINPAGAPSDYLSFIRPAVKAAQQASGLKFVYDGTTTATFNDRQHVSEAGPARIPEPVVIAFPSVLSGANVGGDTIGLGGSTWTTINGAVQPHYVTGAVALLSSWFMQMSAEHHTAAEQTIVMHELGHVLGLGHVQDPSQIMYPQYHGQAHTEPATWRGLRPKAREFVEVTARRARQWPALPGEPLSPPHP